MRERESARAQMRARARETPFPILQGYVAIWEHPRPNHDYQRPTLRHHIAGGQEPVLSSLGFVLLRAENLIVQQHVISLKQIWKMLPKDEMISRPWNFVQRKWRICLKIKTVSEARNLRPWDKIQVNKFNSKALRNWDYNPNKPGRSCRAVREARAWFLELKSSLSSMTRYHFYSSEKIHPWEKWNYI